MTNTPPVRDLFEGVQSTPPLRTGMALLGIHWQREFCDPAHPLNGDMFGWNDMTARYARKFMDDVKPWIDPLHVVDHDGAFDLKSSFVSDGEVDHIYQPIKVYPEAPRIGEKVFYAQGSNCFHPGREKQIVITLADYLVQQRKKILFLTGCNIGFCLASAAIDAANAHTTDPGGAPQKAFTAVVIADLISDGSRALERHPEHYWEDLYDMEYHGVKFARSVDVKALLQTPSMTLDDITLSRNDAVATLGISMTRYRMMLPPGNAEQLDIF